MLLKLIGNVILQSIHDLKISLSIVYDVCVWEGVYLSIFHFCSLQLLLIYSFKACNYTLLKPQEGSSRRITH